MRIDCFDFETSNLNADYGILFCAVIKQVNNGKPIILRWDEQKSYYKEPWSDKELAIKIRDTLEKFDILIPYNGKIFDLPFLNARLMFYNERTIKPMKHIDLYYVSRWKFKISSNSLERFSEFLNVKHRKTKIDGNLWVKALVGARKKIGKKAMDYIVDYCLKDVLVLEECYMKVKDVITYIKTN